jgi:hypothetical protein
MPPIASKGRTLLLSLALLEAWACGVNSALHYWQDAAGNALALLLTLFVRRYWFEIKALLLSSFRGRA